jgi:uncharacterized protein
LRKLASSLEPLQLPLVVIPYYAGVFMPNFTEICFTPSVKAAQTRYGSRAAYGDMDDEEMPDLVHLGRHEAQFIAQRDSFYQATVSATGWPYLQHRGGPAGFLQVIDSQTIAFADFAGNRQYISVGNLHDNDKIALFLMDYVNRRRLKILGRVKIVHQNEHPALLAKLGNPAYRARVERAFVITVEAFDWNCPQHITPRFTQNECEARLHDANKTLHDANQSLHDANQSLRDANQVLQEQLRQAQSPSA